jgi:hypothetical protein
MRRMKEEAEDALVQDIKKNDFSAFALVVVAPTLQTGIQSVVQTYGIGPLKANTILLNWLGRIPRRILDPNDQEFARNLRTARLYGCNLVILDAKADKWEALAEIDKKNLYIDVWWRDDATGRLMLLMAYLMTRNEQWNDARIRLLAIDSEPNSDQTIENLQTMLEEARIEAEAKVVENAGPDIIAEYSADSALVFLPFRIRQNQIVDPFGSAMSDTLFLLPVAAMVLAAEDIDLDAAPEEGEAGEKAQVLDALADARRKAKTASEEAQEAATAAEEARRSAEELGTEPDADEEAVADAERTAAEAEMQAGKLARKAVKAAAKADAAARAAEAAGVLSDEPDDKKGPDDK